MRSLTTAPALQAVHDAACDLPPEQRQRIRLALRALAQAHIDAASDVDDDARKRYRYGAWAVAEIADHV